MSHSSAPSLGGPHFTPTDGDDSFPRNAKILLPTFTRASPSHGSSCHAPGLARQWASRSSHLITTPPFALCPPAARPRAPRCHGADVERRVPAPYLVGKADQLRARENTVHDDAGPLVLDAAPLRPPPAENGPRCSHRARPD